MHATIWCRFGFDFSAPKVIKYVIASKYMICLTPSKLPKYKKKIKCLRSHTFTQFITITVTMNGETLRGWPSLVRAIKGLGG